jgi:hypothetical protein
MWLQGRKIRGKENAGLLHVILYPVLNRRLGHKGHPIKYTTLLLKDCKTRGSSREILEWKLGKSMQMKWNLRQGNKRNSNFILNKRQAASRISPTWQRTASTFTNGNACNNARYHPSSHSKIESLALADGYVTPMMAYSLNKMGCSRRRS